MLEVEAAAALICGGCSGHGDCGRQWRTYKIRHMALTRVADSHLHLRYKQSFAAFCGLPLSKTVHSRVLEQSYLWVYARVRATARRVRWGKGVHLHAGSSATVGAAPACFVQQGSTVACMTRVSYDSACVLRACYGVAQTASQTAGGGSSLANQRWCARVFEVP